MAMHPEHLVVEQLARQWVAAEEKRTQSRADHDRLLLLDRPKEAGRAVVGQDLDVDAPGRRLSVCWGGWRARGQRRIERELGDCRVSRWKDRAAVVAMHSSQHDVRDS